MKFLQNRYMIAMDFSPDAIQASFMAVEMARKQPGSILHYLSIIEPSDIPRPGPLRDVTDPNKNEIEQLKTDLTNLAREHAGHLEDVETHCEIRTGHPASVILNALNEQRPNIIFLGSRGRTKSNEWELGATSAQVLRHAPCPALVARPVDFAAAETTTSTATNAQTQTMKRPSIKPKPAADEAIPAPRPLPSEQAVPNASPLYWSV